MTCVGPESATAARNAKTRRFVYWHAPRQTWLRSRAIASQGLGAEQTVDLFRHWNAFFLNFANVGRLSSSMGRRLGLVEDRPS